MNRKIFVKSKKLEVRAEIFCNSLIVGVFKDRECLYPLEVRLEVLTDMKTFPATAEIEVETLMEMVEGDFRRLVDEGLLIV